MATYLLAWNKAAATIVNGRFAVPVWQGGPEPVSFMLQQCSPTSARLQSVYSEAAIVRAVTVWALRHGVKVVTLQKIVAEFSVGGTH